MRLIFAGLAFGLMLGALATYAVTRIYLLGTTQEQSQLVTNQETSNCDTKPVSETVNPVQQDQLSVSSSIDIQPYTIFEKDGEQFAQFQIKNAENYSNLLAWTDISGSCAAVQMAMQEFVDVKITEDTVYTFFQFIGENNDKSQILAQSHQPLFQCGSLVE